MLTAQLDLIKQTFVEFLLYAEHCLVALKVGLSPCLTGVHDIIEVVL
jgi:hypothetical protein